MLAQCLQCRSNNKLVLGKCSLVGSLNKMLKPEFVEITESFAEVPSKRKREYVDKDNGCERVEKNLWCLQKRQSCNINRGGLTKTSYKNGRAATSTEGD